MYYKCVILHQDLLNVVVNLRYHSFVCAVCMYACMYVCMYICICVC